MRYCTADGHPLLWGDERHGDGESLLTMAPTPEHTHPSSEEATTAAGLDVAETDDFLYSLLLPRFVSMWKYLDGEPISPHRLLWIQALLQGATLWVTRGQTPATTALGLKPVETSGGTRRNSSSPPERASIAKWIVLSVLFPTLYRQLRLWYESSTSIATIEDDPVAQVARERQQSLVRCILDTVDRTVPALRLYALLAWWMGKRQAAPGLSMTLAGISLLSTRPPQRLYVNFAHRRWLYEELVRTLQQLAPFSSWNDFSSCYTG